MLQKLSLFRQIRLYLSAAAVGALFCFLPPLLWSPGSAPAAQPSLLPGSPEPAVTPSAAPSPSPAGGETGEDGIDSARTVDVLQEDGTVVQQPLDDYLWGVVAAEMPAAFEPDVLRAQAVCARTYTAWMMERGSKHEGAHICTDSACCQAYTTREKAAGRWGELAQDYTEKIAAAVADTDGVVAAYGGAPIQALFFSSAAGATEDAAAVWGNSLPYLTSVDSPEGDEVPNYRSAVTLTADEVRQRVAAAYPEADLSGAPEGWFGTPSLTASGRVASISVGGAALSGGAVRSLFSLRSAAFTVSYTGGAFTFSVTGYGHGVGLSQYGANAMARAGSSWQDILLHYYTGVTLQRGW